MPAKGGGHAGTQADKQTGGWVGGLAWDMVGGVVGTRWGEEGVCG